MNITLIIIGKTDADYLKTGFEDYSKRIKRYVNFNISEIKDVKNTKNITEEQQKKMEGEKILNLLKPNDCVVLLDEKGKVLNSRTFANFVEKQGNLSVKNLIFIIGGPYGFSDDVYNRANDKLALSEMTFSHQLVRLIFAEQLYRAFTIINKEPYHHD